MAPALRHRRARANEKPQCGLPTGAAAEGAMANCYHVLDCRLQIYGSFCRARYWFSGWHRELCSLGSVRFIYGYTGKETELTMERIVPACTFEVTASDLQPVLQEE